MNVLVLGPPPEVGFTPVYEYLKGIGEKVTFLWERLQPGAEKYADFIVSHRYRHILSPEICEEFQGRAINLHPSALPWNRGVQPNFFSWMDRTYKGVAIHLIGPEVDAGELVARRYVKLTPEVHTLRSSYTVLQQELFQLFREVWKDFQDRVPWGQEEKGSLNKEETFRAYSHLIWDHGWDTRVTTIVQAGDMLRDQYGYRPV